MFLSRHHSRPVALIAVLLSFLLAACEEEPRRRVTSEPARELSALLYEGKTSSDVDAKSIETLLGDDLRPGLEATLIKDPDGTMLVVSARLALLEPGLRGVTADNPEGAVPDDMLRDDALALLIGSGFVSELMALSPLGLLQVNGEVVNRIERHGYTRVLGIADQRMGVVGHLQYERGLFHSALQVGPGVIEGGKVDISPRDLERQPFFRSLVGTCADQSIFVTSLSPMHLHAMGNALLKFAAKKQLTCDEVVNLAGDREAIMALRFADGRVLFIGNPRTSRSAVVTLESIPAA